MFSLPTRLVQSSLGLRDSAKLSFRTSPSGIKRLWDTSVIDAGDVYWEQFWNLFDSSSEAFTLVTPQDIRQALNSNQLNVGIMIHVLANKLFALVSNSKFPDPTSSIVGGLISTTATPNREPLNCIRMLTRVLPIVFESESEIFEQEVLWRREADSNTETERVQTVESQFVIADEDDDEPPKTPATPAAAKQTTFKASLAERLILCILDLLFYRGFTLPQQTNERLKVDLSIWDAGIGSTANPGTSQQIELNRLEVLRLMQVLLSHPIYFHPLSFLSQHSEYTKFLVQGLPRRQVLTILCSFLNITLNSAGTSFSIPYNHLVWKGEDVHGTVVCLSVQSLCALLDYQSNNAKDKEWSSGETAPSTKTNAFRHAIARLHRASDFDFIILGFSNIFDKHISALNNMLPGATKSVPYLLETVVLFWKFLELNKKFCARLLETERSVDIVAYLYCLALQAKDKPESHGLIRTLSYILESLSAETALGSKMPSAVKTKLPSKWTVPGNFGDYVINSVYSLVSTTSGQLNSMYPAFAITLSNVAPYLENLTVNSSSRLVLLLQSFSNPAFLLSDEGHPRLLNFILETFNAIIQHHATENQNVLYAMMKAHKLFEGLATFTLPKALREIRRIQLQKEQQQVKAANQKQKQKQVVTELPTVDVGQEKARLLESEGAEPQRLSLDILPLSRRSSLSNTVDVFRDGAATSADGTEPMRQQMSEKARGKLPERSHSADLGMSESLEHLALAGVGRNGFVPTQEWVTSWQRALPLDVAQLTISELLPRIQELQHTSSSNAQYHVMNLLRSYDLKPALPLTPPINPRRFQWTDASLVWLSSLIWGEIYVRGMSPFGIWNSTSVRLFHIKHKQAQARQIGGAVSTVVEGLGGLLGRTAERDHAVNGGNGRQTQRPTR